MTTTPKNPKPEYDELANAFATYLAATNMAGGLPYSLQAGDGNLEDHDVEQWEYAIATAQNVVDAAGGKY